MDELDFLDIIETPLIDGGDFLQLLLRFGFNFLVTGIIIHLFYYPKSKRRDYHFTFTLISISIFLMIFLLGSVCYYRHISNKRVGRGSKLWRTNRS